jgi:hypothetical protein
MRPTSRRISPGVGPVGDLERIGGDVEVARSLNIEGSGDLEALLARQAEAIERESVRCSRCSVPSLRVIVTPSGDLVCRNCYFALESEERLGTQATEIVAGLAKYRREWLQRAGMSRLEVDADPARVPEAVKEAIRKVGRGDDLRDGSIPTSGYGLSGGAGVGKTFALASIFGGAVDEWLNRAGRAHGFAALQRPTWLEWLPWPQRAATMRAMSTVDGGFAEVSEMVAGWKVVPALVIDDLGAERMRGGYSEDWITEQLDTVVDARARDGRPTWYTTNLGHQAIVERYGARFYSRLCRVNPLAVVARASDMRGSG